MSDDELDRQGRFWRGVYRRGQRMESAYPVRLPRWNWLNAWAKSHPVIGSALQGVLFGLILLPLLLIFGLVGDPIPPTIGLDLGAMIFFGVAMYGYNRYVSKHGEPWA